MLWLHWCTCLRIVRPTTSMLYKGAEDAPILKERSMDMVGRAIKDKTALLLLGVVLGLGTLVALESLHISSASAAQSDESTLAEEAVHSDSLTEASEQGLATPDNPRHPISRSRIECGWTWRTTTSTVIGSDGQPYTITVTHQVWTCTRVWYLVDHTHNHDVDSD